MTREQICAVWTVLSCGIPSVQAIKLYNEYGSFEEIYKNREQIRKPVNFAAKYAIMAAEDIAETCEKHGFGILPYGDPLFPKRLSGIKNPPALFFYRGNVQHFQRLNDSPALAVVGTRSMTPFGQKITAEITGELASAGVTIISGMAVGIDTIAHESALKAGGFTVAVWGGGLLKLFPAQNAWLAEIIADKGLILTEYPPETHATKYTFPTRNRIVSGLSDGVFVAEAKEKSGALITANRALEQNRPVFVAMTDYSRTGAAEVCELIAEGATPVTGAQHILKALNASLKTKLKLPQPIQQLTLDLTPEPEPEITDPVLIQLQNGALSVDELADRTEMDTRTLVTRLAQLEMDGFITALPGRKYRKAT